MKKIEISILNPESVKEAEKMMVFCARLTQRGHAIKNMNNVHELLNKSYKDSTVKAMTMVPHPTIQKFGLINVAVVGASRRFLSQITRAQYDTKFMSASLQYSDYSDEADFVIPYEIMRDGLETQYLRSCRSAMIDYKAFSSVSGNDPAGYAAPQGLRNVLIISALPFQWKHLINQRICRRNTTETKYVMLKIWEQLYELNPIMFDIDTTGADCQKGKCREGKLCCGRVLGKKRTPTEILKEDFPLLC